LRSRARIAVVASAAFLSGCGVDVVVADRKVNQLCEKDGGIKVFVRDSLPAELLKSDGMIDLDALTYPKTPQKYYLERTRLDIQTSDPHIFRSELRLVRRIDNRLLGIAVVYYRAAQNQGLPFLARASHRCPDINGPAHLVQAVFYTSSEMPKQ